MIPSAHLSAHPGSAVDGVTNTPTHLPALLALLAQARTGEVAA